MGVSGRADYQIDIVKFGDLDLSDPFFDSLKEDYSEFPDWFARKSENEASVIFDESGRLQAFLFIKFETGPLSDVEPPMPAANRMKVGTFKINPHGTRLGERFVKRIVDTAIARGVDEAYVTIFEKHERLVALLGKYGFARTGTKTTPNGTEIVLTKSFRTLSGDILQDYPFIHSRGRRKYLLSIHPEYHTRLLPDSILNTESYDTLEDVSHTNSIHKIYICRMDLSALRPGDILILYRTSDGQGAAHYRSVATSIGVVEKVRQRAEFRDEDTYVKECLPYSVFSETELRNYWKDFSRLFVVKFSYNAALTKRVTRKVLIEDAGLNPGAYWGFLPLNDSQFRHILELGRVQESLVVD
mgnify:CR=1 FL=1|jgi:hypothetical protein